jgi:hypothetical protein
MRKCNLAGQVFGKLTAKESAGIDSTGKTVWKCLCSCGNTTRTTLLNLKSGNTKSCGCLLHRRGVDNPKFIAISPELSKTRKRANAHYKNWRKEILDRQPACLNCGAEDNLNVHHILGYKEYPNLAFDSNNSAVLCFSCHTKFHSAYGRKGGFSESDLQEFIGDSYGSRLLWLITRRRVNGGIADLEKAKHFIDILIELETRDASV